jgi:hypothetical protein
MPIKVNAFIKKMFLLHNNPKPACGVAAQFGVCGKPAGFTVDAPAAI